MINGEEYTSLYSRSERSSAIAAKWCGLSGIDPHGVAPFRVGQIILFIEHSIHLVINQMPSSTSGFQCNTKSHVIARVQWFQDHPRRHFFHSSTIVCSTSR